MKKVILLTLFAFAISNAFAKKVKFAVDMTGFTIEAAGIHIASDFQKLAGLGDDFDTHTALLKQEGTSNIYSLIVDIPAFKKYEFKYINGEEGYQAEFVPLESRALYQFSDFRWLYVDSLRNDTTFVGAIPFEGNAPVGKKLTRFQVELPQGTALDTKGIHLAGDFQNWDTNETVLYSFDGKIHEIIAYIDLKVDEINYKYINGNTAAKYETVQGICVKGTNRNVITTKDTILSVVCYTECIACKTSAINDAALQNATKISPNPFTENLTISFNDESAFHNIEMVNNLGQIIYKNTQITNNQFIIENNNMPIGIYFIKIINDKNKIATFKVIKNN